MGNNVVNVFQIQKKIRSKQETINKNSRKLKKAPKSIWIGWDSSSGTYPEQNKKPVWLVALIHEYGLGNQTEKAMLRTTIDRKSKKWIGKYTKDVKKSLRLMCVPDYNYITQSVGEMMFEDIRRYLYSIDLVDTHRLANSMMVRYKRR